MKKKVFAFIAILLVIAAVVFFLNSRNQPKTVVVRTAQVQTGDIQTWLSTDATVKSKQTKDYYGSAGLTVNKVYVQVGDQVKKGTVLLDYDITDLEMAVRQAEIQYENAVINKRELTKQNERIKEDIADMEAEMLRLDGSTNPQDIARLQTLIQQRDAMETISQEKFELMDNNIALAELAVESAVSRLNKVKDGLVADMDGVVTALNATEDTTLSPAAPSVVLQDLNKLKGIISLGKYDAAKIALGQECILTNSGKTYEGVLSFISPAASMGMTSQNALLEAELDILNPDDGLKVDFEVGVEILTGEVKNTLKLPVESIYYDKNDNSFVYTITDGRAVLTPVKLGLQSDTEAQVLEGVKEGEKIILNPGADITNGTAVLEEGAEND
jgi:HlyD family secretion protein